MYNMERTLNEEMFHSCGFSVSKFQVTPNISYIYEIFFIRAKSLKTDQHSHVRLYKTSV